jgi:hypothetical protein
LHERGREHVGFIITTTRKMTAPIFLTKEKVSPLKPIIDVEQHTKPIS